MAQFSSGELDVEALNVLLRYFPNHGRPQTLKPLGNYNGFSGARLWRCKTEEREICLRAWDDAISEYRLCQIHSLMHKAASLSYVPEVIGSASRTGGQWWDVTTWLPGEADFLERPYPARLGAACTALARLHQVWSGVWADLGPCPAVERRLEAVAEWREILRAGWEPPFRLRMRDADPIATIALRGWRLLSSRLDETSVALAPWGARLFKLQACLCDVRCAHVLFTGDVVTGIVDYGAVKQDHVAVDLARLLGDCAREDRALWEAGFDAYCGVRPLMLEEQALVRVLDRTGVVLGVANWLKWLYRDGRVFENRAEVAQRLSALVERMEAW
jgi:Ser/Thr protein kinase RdoA (MazF antagonist)